MRGRSPQRRRAGSGARRGGREGGRARPGVGRRRGAGSTTIQVTPQMRILVAVEPTDFRRGIDGLCRVCKQDLAGDPFSGAVFAFRNRRWTAVKALVYDGQGFWLCQKRLSQGRFRFWPEGTQRARTKRLQAHELQALLVCGDPAGANAGPAWRPVEVGAEGSER